MTIVANNSITLSNVNDGTITHTAWSYSADGADGFTTVYPNLNLLDGTKDFSGDWERQGGWEIDGTYKGLTVKRKTDAWNGIGKTFIAPKDGKYTFSAYVKSSGNNANIIRFALLNGVDSSSLRMNFSNNFDWTRDSFTVTLKAKDTIFVRYEISGSETDSILWTAGHKWEPGSIATTYMPSASEVTTADWPKYKGEYSDTSSEQSTNPSDYTWTIVRGNDGMDGTDAPTITVKSYTYSAGSRAEIELTGPNAFKETVYNRGHNVWVIDATTHELKEFVSCDTYETMSFSHNGVSTTLADYLTSLKDSIVVIAAADADAVDQNVRDVLNSMGGFPDLKTWGSWRYGHVFIGMSKRNDGTWPLQPRQGYEEYINKDGSAPEIGCTLSKGGIVANGAAGKPGADGKDGIAGKDGVGIKTTVITYAISTSGTMAPTADWKSSVPSLVKGQYLWTKTVWTYTDNSSETGYSVSYISKDGNNGHDGIAGKDGVGIKTTTITYAGSTSGTTAPTSGWATTIPTVAAGSYLWTKTVWVYTDNTSETGYSVAKMGNTGPQGPAGSNGDPGKIVSDTEPSTRFKGLTWKYSGTSDLTASDGTVINPNTEYYYNGTHWMINYLSANNLEANSIKADKIDAKNLTITDGEFVSTTTNGPVTASTEIKDNHIVISKTDRTVNTKNDIALDSEQGFAMKFINNSTNFTQDVAVNPQGFSISDSDGNFAQLTPQGTKLSTDVPWTNITRASGVGTSGTLRARINNGVFYAQSKDVTIPSIAPNFVITIGTMPSIFSGVSGFDALGLLYSTGHLNVASVTVEDRKIRIGNPNSTTMSGKVIQFSINIPLG
ncbi:MAG: interleukin-like EMT inducer domain-containing protein [Lactococcus lactis]